MDIRTIVKYSENARQLLRDILTEHPEVTDKPFETIADYKTIRQILAHMVGAEERWVTKRLQNLPITSNYEERAASTVDGIFADWEQIRKASLRFIGSLSADQLASTMIIDLPKLNRKIEYTMESLLFHAFNHQIWHTGQISMALQRFGVDPPNFDYTLLAD